MKVLVTGGTGFIGTHVVKALLEQGHHPITLSRRREGLPGVEHHSLDVTGDEAIRVASRAEAIVHLAALSNASASYQEPLLYNRVNAMGTLAMLEGARRGGGRFIFASSQRIYRPVPEPIPEDGVVEPQDPYGYSKLCGESWVEMYSRFHGVHAVTLRFFSVYGPGLVIAGGASGVAGIFVGRALRGEPIVAHTGQNRDLTYVSDAAQGILLALEKPVPPGSCYNVATGAGTSMEQLARLVCQITRSRSEIRVESTQSYGYLVADISKARRELGYEPRVELLEGLERYVAWYHSARS
ncbi:MAG: NAD-dependent epimerase/dehydratase family protein [Sphingomonadaceae bacterium]